MSSRIPYGKEVTANKLWQIEKSEDILNNFGINNVRVRHYDSSCKIEVPLSQLELLREYSDEILPRIKKTGFRECILEEEGLISGKLNNALNINND